MYLNPLEAVETCKKKLRIIYDAAKIKAVKLSKEHDDILLYKHGMDSPEVIEFKNALFKNHLKETLYRTLEEVESNNNSLIDVCKKIIKSDGLNKDYIMQYEDGLISIVELFWSVIDK